MKVLVCGGRDYKDQDAMYSALDRAHAKRPIGIVIHGGARGADALADEWAKSRGVLRAVVEALWDKQGRAAGPRRNSGMLTLVPDAVIAFPGGDGTADMVSQATKVGVVVWRPYG